MAKIDLTQITMKIEILKIETLDRIRTSKNQLKFSPKNQYKNLTDSLNQQLSQE